MAAQDPLGLAHSQGEPAAAAAIDDFVRGFLACELRPVLAPLAWAETDAGVLLHCYVTMLCLFSETPTAAAEAAPQLARALDPTTPALPRERLFARALAAWAEGATLQALDLLEQLLAEWPRDLVALKLAQQLAFARGDAPRMLRLALGSRAAAADVAYWHGMVAFGYEQCHWLRAAEGAARQALALLPREPWAQHALAHVMLTEGRFTEGREFMRAASVQWRGLNSFMETHNWWHLALFEIELGDADAALALYDRQVWGVDKRYSQDQVGAVSLLMRLELSGAHLGPRWAELASHLAVRREDHVDPFLSLQYLLGLARAGRDEAQALLAHLQAWAPRAPADGRASWEQVALPAAEGLMAYAQGDFAAAVAGLGQALPRLQEIGGSHAQRDLFEQLYIDALRCGGRPAAAQNLLQPKLNAAPASLRLRRQLQQLNAELGLPA